MKSFWLRHKPIFERENRETGVDLLDSRRAPAGPEKQIPLTADDCFWLGLSTVVEGGGITELFKSGGK